MEKLFNYSQSFVITSHETECLCNFFGAGPFLSRCKIPNNCRKQKFFWRHYSRCNMQYYLSIVINMKADSSKTNYSFLLLQYLIIENMEKENAETHNYLKDVVYLLSPPVFLFTFYSIIL